MVVMGSFWRSCKKYAHQRSRGVRMGRATRSGVFGGRYWRRKDAQEMKEAARLLTAAAALFIGIGAACGVGLSFPAIKYFKCFLCAMHSAQNHS